MSHETLMASRFCMLDLARRNLSRKPFYCSLLSCRLSENAELSVHPKARYCSPGKVWWQFVHSRVRKIGTTGLLVWLARPSHSNAGRSRLGRDGLAAVTISSHLFDQSEEFVLIVFIGLRSFSYTGVGLRL